MHANGDQIWYVNGIRHRDRGPAVVCANGTKIWYRDGKRLDALALKSFDPVRLRKLKPKL